MRTGGSPRRSTRRHTSLGYEVRQAIGTRSDDVPADARPQEATGSAAPVQAGLKPRILPTGNAFLRDPVRRYVRPEGNLGANVLYVRTDFDDHGNP